MLNPTIIKLKKGIHTFILHTTLAQIYPQANRMLYSQLYCNIAIQYCNTDVQVARSKLQSLLSL